MPEWLCTLYIDNLDVTTVNDNNWYNCMDIVIYILFFSLFIHTYTSFFFLYYITVNHAQLK